jgi:20S proteasome subunit alpha 5
VTESVCDLALSFGEGRPKHEGQMSRPFGTALLVGGIDDGKLFLFHTDPSSTYTQCRARAIGGGSEGAETLFRDSYHDGFTLVQAEDLAISTLRQLIQGKLSENNIEVACAKVAARKFEIYSTEERQVIVERLPPQIVPNKGLASMW